MSTREKYFSGEDPARIVLCSLSEKRRKIGKTEHSRDPLSLKIFLGFFVDKTGVGSCALSMSYYQRTFRY